MQQLYPYKHAGYAGCSANLPVGAGEPVFAMPPVTSPVFTPLNIKSEFKPDLSPCSNVTTAPTYCPPPYSVCTSLSEVCKLRSRQGGSVPSVWSLWEFLSQLEGGFGPFPVGCPLTHTETRSLLLSKYPLFVTVSLCPVGLLCLSPLTFQHTTGYYAQVPCIQSMPLSSMPVGIPLHRQDSPDSGINGKPSEPPLLFLLQFFAQG